MITLLFLMFASLAFLFSLSTIALRESRSSRVDLNAKQSYFLTEAGIEDVAYRIARSKQYLPEQTIALNGLTSSVSVADNAGVKILDGVGSVSGAVRKSKLSIAVTTTGVQFFYGVQVGEGGLTMGESSTIKGVGGVAGNVYSNGPVSGGNASKVTGDITVATGITADTEAQSTVCDADQIFGQSNPVVDMAQSFRPSQSKPLSKISLYLKKIGNPGNRTVLITQDSGGSPAQSSLASATLDSGLVTASYGWIDIAFASPPNLAAGNTYWIVINAATNNTKYWSWCKDSSAGYPDGSAKSSQDWDDDPWSAASGDLAFKTYLGSGLSTLEGVIVLGNAHANTIADSKVCGDAYYQTIDASSLNFLNSPAASTCNLPLTPGVAHPGQPDPPLQGMPISQGNLDQWKIDADPDSSPRLGDLVVSSDMSYGPERVTGNLIMDSNNKILTVAGTIYVEGYIDIDNGSAIRCAPSYGATSCIIMADKWIHIANNGIFGGSGQPGSYLVILTTSSCDGTGAGAPCTHHNAAMDLHNNASGTIFYSSNGLTFLHNGVQASEVTAYKLNLENNAEVTYEQGLASAQFAAGPSGGWSIKGWNEVK